MASFDISSFSLDSFDLDSFDFEIQTGGGGGAGSVGLVGGWGAKNDYEAWLQREEKRKKETARYKRPRWVLGPDGWKKVDR